MPLIRTLLLIVIAGAALAHSGVQNPAVMARMNGMSDIAAAMKTLGQMAKGTTAFEAAKANASLQEVAAKAAEIPVLFKAPETDPKSEALPEIWTDFETFQSIAIDLQTAASVEVANLNQLRRAMRNIGPTCNACHKDFRQ